MRFQIEQQILGDVDAVARAFAASDFYGLVGERSKLANAQVLSREEADDGDLVLLRVHYRFLGELSSAVRRLLDPTKLTWVEESRHDLRTRRVEFRMVPDHYGDRFRCAGSYTFAALSDETTRRLADGDLVVKAPLVGRVVEQAIVSGLRGHLEAEVPVVEQFVASRTDG